MNLTKGIEKVTLSILADKNLEDYHCRKDALTDFFGWMLQVLLACLAFTCLVAKRFCEPPQRRRSWQIWFYDTSKQGMGAMAIHLSNVWLAGQYQGDPCTWYFINFLLDSSLGLLIIFIGIRTAQYLSKRKGWAAINFGEYGKPPSINAWFVQCCLYVGLMMIVKILITLFMQMNFWDNVKDFILYPINQNLEVALVMLIIPFFVNILMFWVTDNFLMYKDYRLSRRTSLDSFLQRSRLKYRSLKSKLKRNSESDILLSGDDELLADELNHNMKIVIA